MARRNLKILGLVLALALLCGTLLAGTALAATTKPVLKVNGQTGRVEVDYWTNTTITVIGGPEATAYRVMDDDMDEWDYGPTRTMYDSAVYERYLYDSDSKVHASVCYDEIDWDKFEEDYDYDWDAYTEGEGLTWVEAADVTVKVKASKGEVGEPVATLSSASVTRGANVTVNLTPRSKDEEFYAVVFKPVEETEEPAEGEEAEEGGEEDDPYAKYGERKVLVRDWDDVTNTLIVPTISLEPGDYNLLVGCNAAGYEESVKVFPLTVTKPKTSIPNASIEVLNDDPKVISLLGVAYYAAGADYVQIKIEGPEGYDDDQWYPYESGTAYFWIDEAVGAYNITVRGYKQAEEGEEEAPFVEQSMEVEIDADGRMNPPEFTDVEPFITLGEGASFSYTTPGDNSWGDLVVVLEEDDNRWTYYEHFEDPDPVVHCTLDKSVFPVAGRYHVIVSACTYFMEPDSNEFTILVIDPSLTEAVELTVDGSKDDVEVLSGEPVRFNVHAEGATAVRVLDEEGEWDYRSEPFDEDGDWEEDYGYNKGAHALYAEVSYDNIDWDGLDWEKFDFDRDVNWTARSNVITVTATSPYGQLDAPKFKMPDSVKRGEWLTVEITNDQGVGQWYWADNHLSDGEWLDHYDWNEQGSIEIPTLNLEPGEYSLAVRTDAKGYDSNETWVDFTVTASDLDLTKPILTLSKDTVETLENFTVAGYVPDANNVQINVHKNDNDEDDIWDGPWNDGNTINWTDRQDWEGSYTYLLYANDDFDHVLASVEVEVTADGVVEAPELTLPEQIGVNDDIAGSFTEVKGAELYHLHLRNEWNGELEFFELSSDEVNGSHSFNFGPAEQPGLYKVEVNTLARGKNTGWVEKTVVVAEEAEKEIELTANGGTEDLSVLFGEGISFKVYAPGSTAIRLALNGEFHYRFNDGENEMDMDEPIYFDWGFEDGAHTVFAQAYYGDLEEQEDGSLFPSSPYGWVGMSNTITINVSEAEGELDVPEYELNLKNGTIAQNQILKAKILNLPEDIDDVWYGLRLSASEDREDGIGEEYWNTHGGGDGPAYRLNEGLEPGDYWVWISNWKDGYRGNDAEPQKITVVEGEDKSFVVSETEAYVGADVQAVIHAKGADEIRLLWSYEGEGEMDEGEDSWEGDHVDIDLSNTSFNQWAVGVHELTAEARYGDEWETIGTETIRLDSKGRLDAPDVTAPHILEYGENLKFYFGKVDDAEWYIVNIYDIDVWDEMILGIDWEPGENEITSDDMLSGQRFEYGHVYEIQVSSWKPGYQNGWNRCLFAVGNPDNVLKLPENLTTIEEGAFEGIKAEVVVIPDGVEHIAKDAFKDCKNLVFVDIPDSAEYDEGAFPDNATIIWR